MVLDRRVGDRRRMTVPVSVERRSGQRRVANPERAMELEEMWFAIIETAQ